MASNKHDSQTRGMGESTEVKLQQDPKTREAQISGYKRDETRVSAGSEMHRGLSTACTWGHSSHTTAQLVPQEHEHLLPIKDNNFRPVVL